MMDKRLNHKYIYKSDMPDKIEEGIRIIRERHKKPIKGSVTLNYDKYGNVKSVENNKII